MNAKVHCTHLTSLYELDPRNSNHTFSGPLAEYAMVKEIYLDDLPLRVHGLQVLTPRLESSSPSIMRIFFRATIFRRQSQPAALCSTYERIDFTDAFLRPGCSVVKWFERSLSDIWLAHCPSLGLEPYVNLLRKLQSSGVGLLRRWIGFYYWRWRETCSTTTPFIPVRF